MSEALVFEAKSTGQKIVFGPHGAFATEKMHREKLLADFRATAARRNEQAAVRGDPPLDIEAMPEFKQLAQIVDVFLPVSVFVNDGTLPDNQADAELTKGAMVRHHDARITTKVRAFANNPASDVVGLGFVDAKQIVLTSNPDVRRGLGFDDAEKAEEATTGGEPEKREGYAADEVWWGREDEEGAKDILSVMESVPNTAQLFAVIRWMNAQKVPAKLVKAVERGLRPKR